MFIKMKEKIREKYPNFADYWTLIKHKKDVYNRTHKQIKLKESDYPLYLETFYNNRTGHQLCINDPKRFTEKIQWRKLYDKDSVYTFLSDKYKVREWVKSKIGEEYLIPLLGHWNHFDEIDFSLLPNQFVLKTNNGCHENYIVKNKEEFLRKKWVARKTMEYWLTSPIYYDGLELHYKDIPPLIIAEEYLEPKQGDSCLVDYKFHCFNGKPFTCQVIEGRTTKETVDVYDINWNHLPIKHPAFPNTNQKRDKPLNYDLMLELATKLSQGFQYVRVDLYSTDHVFFGEMTFTPANGAERYIPDSWDLEMGKQWKINVEQVNHSIVTGGKF